MNTIRAFIAIELPTDLQNGLRQVIQQLSQGTKAVRWLAAENIHLTIKFLGDVEISRVQALQAALQQEASHHLPFEIQVGTLGTFPNSRRPRVVWMGVQAPQELFALQQGFEAVTRPLGYPTEKRPFTAHLTLGRVSEHASPDEAAQFGFLLAKKQVNPLGKVQVNTIHLFKSDLRSTGAVYTSLFQAKLFLGNLPCIVPDLGVITPKSKDRSGGDSD